MFAWRLSNLTISLTYPVSYTKLGMSMCFERVKARFLRAVDILMLSWDKPRGTESSGVWERVEIQG